MDWINYTLFVIAGVITFGALVYLWVHEFSALRADLHEEALASVDEHGRRRNVMRRDEVADVIRSYRKLERRYHFRNRLMILVVVPFTLTTIAGLRWQNDTSQQAKSTSQQASGAAHKANQSIAQIQAERRRNTLRACLQAHGRDVDLDRNNAGLRGFILVTLPPSVKREPKVAAYLRAHPAEFPPLPALGVERPSGQATSAEFVIAYLERAADTWPVIKEARRTPAQVEKACRVQVNKAVRPPVATKTRG